jgi:phosphatidylinositol 4-kinase A
MAARLHLSTNIRSTSAAFKVYLEDLLDNIVSKGDAIEGSRQRVPVSELAAKEIAQLLPPLSTLLASNSNTVGEWDLHDTTIILQRDAWFNIVVHGFNLISPLGRKYLAELKTIAQYSQPLIAEERADQVESDVELNTVLRRGMTPEHAIVQKGHLLKLLPSCEADIKSLSYPETVFLNTAYLVEELRASGGDFTKALTYFLDPKLRSGAMGSCMFAIATVATRTYVSKTLSGNLQAFSTPYLAQQLATIFAGCCHRIVRIQQVATACADIIVKEVPSTLCQKTALFSLLELLTMIWSSCLEGETDEYGWTSTFTSSKGNIVVELSDDYAFRRKTLSSFYTQAKSWVLQVLDMAPLDIKGLLQVGPSSTLMLYPSLLKRV